MMHATAASTATTPFPSSSTLGSKIRIPTRSDFIQQRGLGDLATLKLTKKSAYESLKEILGPRSRYKFSVAEIHEFSELLDRANFKSLKMLEV